MLVYTAITNDYDTLPLVRPEVRKICFTDNPDLKADGWEMRAIKDHKEPKILSHKYFNEPTLWIDANIELYKMPVISPQTARIATFRAKDYQCAYIEAEVCKNGKDHPDNIDKQVKVMRDDGYPENNGLSCCGVIWRSGEDVKELEELWWEQLKRTRRDQISFNYCLWKLGMTQGYIPGTIYENDYLKWLIVHK